MDSIKLKIETEGMDDLAEKVDELNDAFNEFNSQVIIKRCENCTFNIYPSQTKICSVDGSGDKNDQNEEKM